MNNLSIIKIFSSRTVVNGRNSNSYFKKTSALANYSAHPIVTLLNCLTLNEAREYMMAIFINLKTANCAQQCFMFFSALCCSCVKNSFFLTLVIELVPIQRKKKTFYRGSCYS